MHQEVSIPYGMSQLKWEMPVDGNHWLLSSRDLPSVPNLAEAVRHALEQPIGAPRIRDAVQVGDRVAIVINDITRPAPSGIIVREIAKDLAVAGVEDSQVVILVATGTHRPNTRQELKEMLGEEIVERFLVVNHDCRDNNNLVHVGTTPGGTPVVINRLFAEASYRILTGVITPHPAAGYSGGRKSVIPGLAGLEALKRHHSFPIRPYHPAMGRLDDNPFHLEALAAAKTVGVDMIVNVVPNSKGQLVGVVAGDLELAHAAGVDICASMCRCVVPQQADIVITGPGGYPRDINLYQAQKAVSVAETIVKDGGTIILVAECSLGLSDDDFAGWLIEARSPHEVIQRFEIDGFGSGGHKAFMFARAAARCRVIVVTSYLLREQLGQMFMEQAQTLEEALEMAGKTGGDGRKVAVIPRAIHIIPEVKNQ